MRHLLHSAAALALIAAASAAGAPAFAQAAQDRVAASPASNEVESVVVTARKTEETVREVPATITAVTSAQLAATGPVTGTGDLLRTVPGVRFNDLQAPNLSEVSIRGSGTERATGADSAVGLFVNGAYVGSSTLGGRNFRNLDFFDVERIEVLEGPQSALYGRNAEFGVVNIISAKPKFDSSGFFDETFTNKLNQNRLIGVLNHAFNDEVAGRIGVEAIGQGKGFYQNPVNNQYYDVTQGWLGRGQLRYRHGPLDVDLLADAQDLELPAFVSGFEVQPGTTTTIPLGFTNDRFKVPSNGINDTRQRVQRLQLLGDLDLGWATLSSTTMVSHFTSLQWFGSSIDLATEAQLQGQGEIGVYPLTQVHTEAKDHTYYQDLHLTGKAFGGAGDWLAGLEVMDQRDENYLLQQTSPCTLTATSGICGGTPTTPLCFRLLPTSTNCPATFPASFGQVSITRQHYTSEAAYASLRYRIQDLTLSAEGRYTNDKKRAVQAATALFTNAAVNTPTGVEFKAGRFSYALTASYKLPGPWQDLVYAKMGTGYRAGGVNNGTSSPVAPVPFRNNYSDEDTTSYELGFKGNLGANIFVTVDGYLSRTKNAISVINDGCTLVNVCRKGATIFNINGGNIQAEGVELAIDGRFHVAGGRLAVGLNGSRQHAKVQSVNGTFAGLPIVGSRVAQIPDWTSSATLDYRHPLTDNIEGFAHLTYHGQSGGGQDTVTPTAPFVPMANVTDVTFRAGVDWGAVEAAVFVKNLTDDTIKLLFLQTAGVTTQVRYNQPRTVGVNLVYRW